MKLRKFAWCTLLALAAPALADDKTPYTQQQVLDFIKAAGWEICDSARNDPPANVTGATAKHLVQVGKPCDDASKAKPNVLFAFEFDNSANRDKAVGMFEATYHAAIIEEGSAWPIGERFAIFASGPAHQLVHDSLDAQLAKMKATQK